MKRKETYLSRDFRDTAAQRFPAQAKQLNAAFDILHTQKPACVCEISVIFFVFRYTLGPVSYTHLDVYKRQEMRCDHVEKSNGISKKSNEPDVSGQGDL